MAKHEAVVFGFPKPDGTIEYKSNDPYWQAEQLLAGQEQTDTGDDELARLREENESLKAQVAGGTQLPSSVTEGVDDDATEEDDSDDEFANLNGKELKAKAAELDVDISGLRKVGEVRQALRDHVAAQG